MHFKILMILVIAWVQTFTQNNFYNSSAGKPINSKEKYNIIGSWYVDTILDDKSLVLNLSPDGRFWYMRFDEEGYIDIDYYTDHGLCSAQEIFSAEYLLNRDTLSISDKNSYLPDYFIADYLISKPKDSVLIIKLIRQRTPEYSSIYSQNYFVGFDSLYPEYKDAIQRNMQVEIEWEKVGDSLTIAHWGTDTLFSILNPVNQSSSILFWHGYPDYLSELKRDDRLQAVNEIIIQTPIKVYATLNRFILECFLKNCKGDFCEPFYLVY